MTCSAMLLLVVFSVPAFALPSAEQAAMCQNSENKALCNEGAGGLKAKDLSVSLVQMGMEIFSAPVPADEDVLRPLSPEEEDDELAAAGSLSLFQDSVSLVRDPAVVDLRPTFGDFEDDDAMLGLMDAMHDYGKM